MKMLALGLLFAIAAASDTARNGKAAPAPSAASPKADSAKTAKPAPVGAGNPSAPVTPEATTPSEAATLGAPNAPAESYDEEPF